MHYNGISSEIIDSYTRTEAIEDGFLIDVSEVARTMGFKIPVAVTASLWSHCIEWNPENQSQFVQSTKARLLSVLRKLYFKMLDHLVCQIKHTNTFFYEIWAIPNKATSLYPDEVMLRAVCGFGDNQEPVLTILLKDED